MVGSVIHISNSDLDNYKSSVAVTVLDLIRLSLRYPPDGADQELLREAPALPLASV